MTIHRGECGHIKSHWDNHLKCISCSHCSRESTCSTCSLWSDSIWDQKKEMRRTFASRKLAMSKKKKRSQALSDSSVEEKNHGSTTPHGPAARGKTHKGGNSKGSCPFGSISPPATGHRATDHRASSYWPTVQWTRRRHGPATDHHRAQVTDHPLRVTVHRPNGHNT